MGSPVDPVISRIMRSWPDLQYQLRFSFCLTGLKSNGKVMGYLTNICITFAFIGMACLTKLRCSSQCSDLSKAIEISSSKLYIVPSAMMEVSH